MDSLKLFNESVPDPYEPGIRWAVDSSGNIHRFSGKGGDGTFHWNGSTGDKLVPLKKNNYSSVYTKGIQL